MSDHNHTCITMLHTTYKVCKLASMHQSFSKPWGDPPRFVVCYKVRGHMSLSCTFWCLRAKAIATEDHTHTHTFQMRCVNFRCTFHYIITYKRSFRSKILYGRIFVCGEIQQRHQMPLDSLWLDGYWCGSDRAIQVSGIGLIERKRMNSSVSKCSEMQTCT